MTLTEMIVAVLIMAIGILGVAGLQVVSIQQNRSALIRGQALQIGNDMLDRIRANRDGDYDGVTFAAAPPVDAEDCTAGTCTEAEMAEYDIAQWKCELNSNDPAGDPFAICVTLGIAGVLPNGEGQIEVVDGVHEVTVRWQSGSAGQTSNMILRARTE